MNKKAALYHIISTGKCHGLECEECPIAKDEADKIPFGYKCGAKSDDVDEWSKNIYRKAIEMYVEKYGTEDVVEALI